jgi:plastocyanin
MKFHCPVVAGALGLAALLVLGGCGGGDPKTSGGPSGSGNTGANGTAANEPAATVDPATAGTISGKVTLEGTAPAAKDISVEGDPYCAAKHPSGLKSEGALVSASGEIENVFVWIKKGVKGSYPAPTTPVVLDQSGCRYSPHVLGIQVGQELVIRNSDETMHNVHSIPKANEEFNFAQTGKGNENKKSFVLQEVMVKFKCDVHGWMNAYIGVVKHPFFKVTGADGTFELKNVPPGEYEVEAWHEKFGAKQATVKLEAKGTVKVDFLLKGN